MSVRDRLPMPSPRGWRPAGAPRDGGSVRADAVCAGAAVGFVVLAWLVGTWLSAHNADGGGVHAPTPPLYAGFGPRLGPGSPAAVLVAVLVVAFGPRVCAALRWRRLLFVAYLAALAWTFSLALIDGWQVGIAGRLSAPTEYLAQVPAVTDVAAFLRGFTSHILAFQPGSFTTHVAAHPPLAVLLFVTLDRVGLGGGGPAGVLCILVGASAPVAVAVTLRALGGEELGSGGLGAGGQASGGPGGERLARAVLPFGVLAPAAIWVGVSADGLYAGVLAWAVCALAVASRWWCAVAAGLLFGCCLYFSYGLALAGVFVPAVVVLTRRVATVLGAGVGVAAVAAAFTVSGFWWWRGYQLTKLLYAQPLQFGSADRSYGYWVWAAPAAFAVTLGPATIAGLGRLCTPASRRSHPRESTFSAPRVDVLSTASRRALLALCLAALLAVLVADLSGLSRGESERIWLPFGVWLLPACGLLPDRHARWWLAGQAAVALAVNHLLVPPW